MFDWRTLAPDRCFLCGRSIARREGDREHFIPRIFFEGGKIPNGLPHVAPLPSHRVCNSSTHLIEERVAIVWATGGGPPDADHSETERWLRSVRALKHPKKAALLASFLSHTEELPDGSARLRIPNDGTYWVLGKMLKGIVYQDLGRFIDPAMLWAIVMRPPETLVDTPGTVFDVPGVLRATYEADGEGTVAATFTVYDTHGFLVCAFRAGSRTHHSLRNLPRVALSWPHWQRH